VEQVVTQAPPNSAEATDSWARWEYSPEEWKRFEQLDWGRARNTLLAVAVVTVAVFMGFTAFVFMNVNASSPQTSFPDYSILLLMTPLMLFMAFLLTYFLAGRRWLEARKRHLARRSGPGRVTIGAPSSFFEQGLWIAGTYVPLQETFLELASVRMTQNPPMLHLRRTHVEIRQSSWHDTIHILVPYAHEAEAARLVERFRIETIAPLHKDTAPTEP
jgi:hypothetical protein